jgi:hypothetical protein
MTIYIDRKAVKTVQSVIRYIRDVAILTAVTSGTAFAIAAILDLGRAL